jgi:hypothetical protein
LENLSNDEDLDRTWGNIKENIKTSAKESLGLHELKENKLWFDEEYLGFLNHRKRDKMQWILDTSKNKLDNLNSVRREVSRHIRNKKKACLRAKIEEPETKSKIQNIRVLYRGINDLRRGTNPDVIQLRMRKATWLQIPTVLRNVGGIISPSFSTCMVLMM